MAHTTYNDNNPGAQLGITLIFTLTGYCVFMVLSMLLAVLIYGLNLSNLQDIQNISNPKNVQILKFVQVVFSFGIFIIIPVLLAYLFSGNSMSYLKINKNPSGLKLGLAAIIIIGAIPLINLLGELNSHMKLPSFMSGLEKFLMETEKANDNIAETFLKVNTMGGMVVNLLMISIIPAIGEEFFFRGILQRILSNLAKNTHWGIILSAFIFSAIHMQFYGFLPRWLLGIMFGYMFVWSGSLWLPILAHFLNNTIIEFAYYLVNGKIISQKIFDIGSTWEFWPITLTMTLLMAIGIYQLYKRRLSDTRI